MIDPDKFSKILNKQLKVTIWSSRLFIKNMFVNHLKKI